VGIPFVDDAGHCSCEVQCPYLRQKPFLIFGVDPFQAANLSIEFIQMLLKDRADLFDFGGAPLTLPPISLEMLIDKRPATLGEAAAYQWDTMEFMHQRRFEEALDRGLRALETLSDPGLRRGIYTEIDALHVVVKDHEGALVCAKRCVEEFPDDSFAWKRLAQQYAINLRDGQESEADFDQAVHYMETAIKKARDEDAWVRECMLVLCRTLKRAERYGHLEEAIRELLADFQNRRAEDTIAIDIKWALSLSAGSVDQDVLASLAQLKSATDDFAKAVSESPERCRAPNWEDLKPYMD